MAGTRSHRAAGLQRSNDNNANWVTAKQPLSKKTSLLPAVKEKLHTALSDLKKAVVNRKKSPWLLSRSSQYSLDDDDNDNDNDNNNDNDKRLGLTAQADQPDHKKYSTLKIKLTMKQYISYNRVKSKRRIRFAE